MKTSRVQQRIFLWITTSRLAVPLLIASIVGVCTGFLIVGFIHFIEFCQHLFFDQGEKALSFMGRYWIILIPALSLFAAFIVLLSVSAGCKIGQVGPFEPGSRGICESCNDHPDCEEGLICKRFSNSQTVRWLCAFPTTTRCSSDNVVLKEGANPSYENE